MKKLFTLLLAALMLLSLAACGVPQSDNSGTTANDAQAATGDAAGNDTTAAVETTAAELSFQEVTVVDNEYCTIKITGIDPDNLFGYTLNAYLENKSADKTYMFSVQSASVNGVQSDPLFASEVAAGKKANENIIFTSPDLEENGIVDYTDIELSFRVYDSDDWMAEPVAEPVTHVYPYGEANAVSFTREAQDTDIVLVDNEFATVIVTGFEKDDIWGYSANLYLVNKTDASVMFSVDDASVNGFMLDPLFATSVNAGKCAFSSVTWMQNSLDENSITEVETIEFLLRAYQADDIFAEDLVNQTVTLNP